MNLRKYGSKYLLFVEIAALIIVLLYGALHFAVPTKTDKSRLGTEQAEKQPVPESGTGKDAAEESQQTAETDKQQMKYSDAVSAKVKEMTAEEKVCQLFITRPEEITGVKQFTQAGNKTKEAIETYPLGGFVFAEGNFGGKNLTQKMMSNIQKYVKDRIGVPMILAVNEMGGDSSPLASKNNYNKEADPADWNSADQAASSSGNIAQYIKECGLNTNLAPDVQAFGGDTDLSAAMVTASITSYNENGLYTAAKVFPGNQIEQPEEQLAPFKSAAKAGATFMMVGNNPCESVTKDASAPCSTSSAAVDYIRNTLKYNGTIMTDDLAAGLSDGRSQEDAAVAAIKAGVDMIYVSTGFINSYNAVLEAAKQGDIPQERLDDAVSRVLTAKGM
ncbi:MAG: glycoside hydrolase family 3 N-terminal domain-containing protein [Clostridiaceae bacterium]|nr:glycoside hydrolase family 3 N-terminal domain-containing protein [Clostridiaceae bacterium]